MTCWVYLSMRARESALAGFSGAANRNRSVVVRLGVFIVVAAAWLVVTPAAIAQADLSLNILVITSEHSRDSNSTTRNLRVAGNTLLYSETYQGARSNRRQPISKEFELAGADRDRLIALLKNQSLLRTKSISRPAVQKGSSREFEIKIEAKLARQESLISIKAPRSATDLKTDQLFQGAVLLITELFKIINRTDQDISLGELIG